MRAPFIASGSKQLRESKAYRVALEELREAIRARYAAELERAGFAGFLRSCFLRCKMRVEFHRERRNLIPSPQSLYLLPKQAK